jgi:predicted PurR-regulated permease PerM
MEKNKIDYKLVNMAILAFIIYIAYSTSNLWFGIIGKICNILVPFLFAFAVAYAMYPFLEKMKGKVPKGLGVFIIILGILALLAIVVYCNTIGWTII